MRSLFLTAALAALAPSPRRSLAPADWREIRQRAEQLYSEKSYELAHRAYDEAATLPLAENDRRWLLFRLADTDWRSAASSENPDTTRIERAKSALESLQKEVDRPEEKDATWAEVEESLADFEWVRRESQNFGGALPHYRSALDFWAGARDVETARARTLAIVFRMAWPARGDRSGNEWLGSWWCGQIPIEIADDARRIAAAQSDRAQAAFLFANVVRNQGGDFEKLRRGLEALDDAISLGNETPWLDDALWLAAQWRESQGEPVLQQDGSFTQQPDFLKSLALYRRLLDEFGKGRSRWHDSAKEAIARILRKEVGLSVSQAFLPGSEIAFNLSWRNVQRVDLALYPVDLTKAVDFRRSGNRSDNSSSGWLSTIDLSDVEPRARWAYGTKDAGEHRPGNAEVKIGAAELRSAEKLSPGAYVLEARAPQNGVQSAREIVLVSETTLFLKSVGDQALAWVTDALTSQPIAGAEVAVWERFSQNSQWTWRVQRVKTGDDGTVSVRLRADENTEELFVAASRGERAAFVLGGSTWRRGQSEPWRIFAFTDRSTYRPADRVEWKVVARTKQDATYATPSGASLSYEIADPQGAVVGKGQLALNAFGSAWGNFDTGAAFALGEYRITFMEKRGNSVRTVGGATLFRLEEYKLPEFEVKVSTSDENGHARLFRLGDRVEASIEARTYFGAPVGNADVEVLVHQNPYWRRRVPERDVPWLYAESERLAWNPYAGPGQIVARIAAKTDAEGRASVAFDTSRGLAQDQEYTLEARVVDASRREIVGRGKVRVARFAYSVLAHAEHNVHRPGDQVAFVFEVEDANGNPVAAQGGVKVVRNRWVEVWVDSNGKETRGPRAPEGSRDPLSGWKAKFQGYETEEISSTTLVADAHGKARLAFAAPSEGFYTATWKSADPRAGAIEASASAWVASGSTAELGYHAGGLDLVVDKDTFRVGETAPVLVCTPQSNRWVLVSVESEILHSYQVVHLDGTAKLVELPIRAEHVPNFVLSALTASDGDALLDQEEVVVPPVEQFLTVDVTPDRGEILPGGEGTLSVRTLDHRGEPVAAEVALSLVDEAVAAIQAEYAGDPRQFFFGERRSLWVRTQSSFDQRRYARLVLSKDGALRDERQAGAGGRRDGGYKEEDLGQLAGADELSFRERKNQLGRAVSDMAAAPASKMAASPSVAAEMEGTVRAGIEGSPVQVRSDFRETALWRPDLVTDARGQASVRVKYPESLTRWKATARAASSDARFGFATTSTRTEKPLIARLQCPRFFVVGDEVTISALLDNRTGAPLQVKPELDAGGLELLTPPPALVEVPARGQARVDWKARVTVAGTAKLSLSARAGELSDGMEKSFTMWPHGVDALVACALKLKGAELACALDVPAARRRESTEMLVQVSPSLAVTMLDALPYLVDYPYGCTEQTLSRFLPAAIVAKTLRDQGLSAEDAMSRVFGGIEPETASATHKKGKRSLAELDAMIAKGLERLYDFQHGDGGWGWWKEGESDPYMTAYVVWGLSLARGAGVDVRSGAIERGARFLSVEIVEAEDQADLAAWMLHGLAVSGSARNDPLADAAFQKLWKDRDGLNAYTRALFALAAKAMGREEEARTLARNLANGAQVDESPDGSRIERAAGGSHEAAMRTAHWGADRVWRRWSEGPVESTSFALRALLAVDPSNPLAEQAVNWLIQNRRGAQWSNTRDTAITVLALNDWLRASGEVARDVEYELLVNGKSLGRRKVTAAQMLSAPGEFRVPALQVADGANEIRLRRISGEGPLYLAARASFFSLEDPVPPRGSQMFAKRQYYKMVGRPTLLKGPVYERVPLEDGGSVQSGERVEVVLTLEAKNDFEYLLFEDLKPAGLEAVQVKSGEACFARELKSGEVEHRFGPAGSSGESGGATLIADPIDAARYTQRQRSVHQELRDRNVAFFLDKLPQGVWEIRYDLRAEVPGTFHALPVLGHAMYVPEIRCNGAEARITVTERGAQGE